MKTIVTTSASPFQFGHLHLYQNAIKIFGEENVSVAIGKNANKQIDFNVILFHLVPYKIKYTIVENQLLSDFCEQNKINYIVRGIRTSADIEYELKLDFFNKKLNSNVNTIFFPAKENFEHISSKSINELLKYKKLDLCKLYMNEDSLYRFFYKMPKFTIFFGPSCFGKSFYLKEFFKNKNVIDVDTIFWKIFEITFGKDEGIKIKQQSKDMVYNKNNLANLISQYSTENFWINFFEYLEKNYESYDLNNYTILKNNNKTFIIDFASIGSYWHTIPSFIKGYFYLIKLTNTNTNRDKYIKCKNFTQKIGFLDNFYKEPEYFDMEIKINEQI